MSLWLSVIGVFDGPLGFIGMAGWLVMLVPAAIAGPFMWLVAAGQWGREA